MGIQGYVYGYGVILTFPNNTPEEDYGDYMMDTLEKVTNDPIDIDRPILYENKDLYTCVLLMNSTYHICRSEYHCDGTSSEGCEMKHHINGVWSLPVIQCLVKPDSISTELHDLMMKLCNNHGFKRYKPDEFPVGWYQYNPSF
jgi:hypothetical protein